MMNKWTLGTDGSILRAVNTQDDCGWEDHLEMSGTRISHQVKYGVDADGSLTLSQVVVHPTLRRIPNNTGASTFIHYRKEMLLSPLVGGNIVIGERPFAFRFDGVLEIKSHTDAGVTITRTLFPSRTLPAAIELIAVTNVSQESLTVALPGMAEQTVRRGCFGIYLAEATMAEHPAVVLAPGQTLTGALCFTGRKQLEAPVTVADPVAELAARHGFIDSLHRSLELNTPDPVLNQAFMFAKLRACESVFENRCGLLHSPGGLSYYAAIWANDQAEYAGPFFPFIGDKNAVEASLNAYQLFIPFMGPDYSPIPSSIIAEGLDIWEGAGDRGDAAMYAYGASRFALALGDTAVAQKLWEPIEWCLEYCHRKLTPDGVVASDSDELEGRFPTGKANLSTSSLAYGALVSAANLADGLALPDRAKLYRDRAAALELAIERYFGATIDGFDTYRYYDGNDCLRSWICLPLTMGIFRRAQGTIDALFSHKLWTEDGLKTQSGETTYWDRSTLYGFRGVIAAGEEEKAFAYLHSYSERRTLGAHVPYPVEAYPEGNQRHLSGESALYCRIYTEGIFGITPTGLSCFTLTPHLPRSWDKMELRRLHLCGTEWDISISAEGDGMLITVTGGGKTRNYACAHGQTVTIATKE
ncbi:MAG: hypothetical protein RR022_00800 [Angelakisella sp.]